MNWSDIENIALLLIETYPDDDPGRLDLADIQNRTCDLEDFDDDPRGSTEKGLERIQGAWVDLLEEEENG